MRYSTKYTLNLIFDHTISSLITQFHLKPLLHLFLPADTSILRFLNSVRPTLLHPGLAINQQS